MAANNVRPFKIAVPDAAIERLHRKLADAVFPEEVDFSDDWTFGAPLSEVRRLAEVWRTKFDWRAAEARLNAQLPQFMTTISVTNHEDVDVHFVHKKSSSNPNAIPLLFVHGWPGSFIEVTKIIDELTDPSDPSAPAFHVVAPSLPNFGFSGRTRTRNFGMLQTTEVCHKVMLAAGYEKYVTQGGDLGSYFTRGVGMMYPDSVLASHLNFVLAFPPPPPPASADGGSAEDPTANMSEAEKAGLARSKWYEEQASGYREIQGTRPHAIGFALADSPVALLAWVYEKLHDWTDDYPWTDDEVLTWISIHAFSTAGFDASVRIYYEAKNPKPDEMALAYGMMFGWTDKPLGVSIFPKDLFVFPDAYLATTGKFVFSRRHESGGHFAAFEKPDVLVKDVRDMFGKGGPAEKYLAPLYNE